MAHIAAREGETTMLLQHAVVLQAGGPADDSQHLESEDHVVSRPPVREFLRVVFRAGGFRV